MKWSVLLLLPAVSCQAAIVTALSPEYTDVTNAVYAASAGDTVRVPTGSAIWDKVLELTNSVFLIGAGTNSTAITNAIPLAAPWSAGLRPPLIWIKTPSDALFRISGFRFFCNDLSGGQCVYFDAKNRPGNPAIHGFRFDHCLVEQAKSRALELEGAVYGVIDHCYFLDCELTTEPVDTDQAEWNRFTPPYYGLGTTNTLVVEDCTVHYGQWTYDNSRAPAPAACGQGSHYVWRYNIVTNSADTLADGLDLHGNNHLYSYDGWRGSIWFECYKNKFYGPTGLHGYRSMNLRGGTCVVWSNEFFGTTTQQAIILQEEETWDEDNYDAPLDRPLHVLTAWPAQDQITNTFIWSNKLNGTSWANPVKLYDADPERNPVTAGTENNPVAIAIQEDRDYWLRAPQAGDKIENYTPLKYPHPIVTAQDGIQITANSIRANSIRFTSP